MLRLPCKTRFATNFFMVESLLRNKNVVMETFVCAPFFEWKGGQIEYIKANIFSLRDEIASKVFWDEGRRCISCYDGYNFFIVTIRL